MPPQEPSPRKFHPLAWKIFVAGLVVLTVGVVRVNLFGPRVPVQPVATPTFRAREPHPMRIVVTIPPLMWAVKALAPPDAQITLLSPAGAGCEGIELTPSHVVAIERADLVVSAGGGLESGMADVNQQRSQQRLIAFDTAHDVRLGDGESAQPVSTFGPHVWLDPMVMEKFTVVIYNGLAPILHEIDRVEHPEWHGDDVHENLLLLVKRGKSPLGDRGSIADIQRECRIVGAEYSNRLAPFKGRSIITHHDAWSVVARRYGLEVAAVIQHTHDAEPSPADLADAARIMKEKGIKCIFVEPQLNPAAANRIAQITGAKVLTLDPIGDGDWPAMMRKNLDALVEGLSAN